MLARIFWCLRWALAAWALSLSACSLILGDFTVKPGPPDASVGGRGGSSGAGGDSSVGGNGGDAGPGLIVVDPTSGLITTEQGGQTTFTIVLRAKPASAVSIALTSTNTNEGIVLPPSVTFTVDNWAAPQTVTVTGVADSVKDGDQTYRIETSSASSADKTFAGFDPPDVTVVNIDNQTPGFQVRPTSGLRTSEWGDQDTFTIELNSPPTDDVTIALSSNNELEGLVSPASVKFTSRNWNAPQTVTVTGVDDGATPDGDKDYRIVTGPAQSLDSGYAGKDPPDVAVINVDDDSAGFTVTPRSGLETREDGMMATFTVALNSAPTADVILPLSSSNSGEGIPLPTSLTFTPVNWKAPQPVTVTGIPDDHIADGNQLYLIQIGPAQSDDPTYAGKKPSPVLVTNIDIDSAGIQVTPRTGLSTRETGESTTFTVVLNSKPTADVTVSLTTIASTEGAVSPELLTFTPRNWNAPQTVTVTGRDDFIDDGDQRYVVRFTPASSMDLGYNGRVVPDVPVINIDNDQAGVTVTPTSGLTTTEAGGTATFTVVLNSQPLMNVTIGVASNNAREGAVSQTSLTFTPANWRAPQTVTVTGGNDDIADGNQPYRITLAPASSPDPGYNGLDPTDVTVTNTDNDSPGITITPVTGLTTSEAGGSTRFTIVLHSEPTAPVSIALSSTNTAEGNVSPPTVTFTPANWRAPQTVTITGQNDDTDDGDQQYRIHFNASVSTDTTGYNARTTPDLVVTNVDNDTAGITVTPVGNLSTTEGGGTATFTVVLNSRPASGTVSIGLSTNNNLEGTVGPASLTFTIDNWRAPQTVTVTGVNDPVDDGNIPYLIVTAASTSTADALYRGINPPDVSVTNIDDDQAGIAVEPVSNLFTSEDLGTATFRVFLRSLPRNNATVTVPVNTSNTAEGTVSPASLTFTSANWNAAQTVTIRGVNDNFDDGDQPYTILLARATSTDAAYAAIDPPDVSVINVDNDSAGINVVAAANLITTETGGTVTFTVALRSQPQGTNTTVNVPISSTDTTEGRVSTASLTFTTTNWASPQTVTVTGVDDAADDNNVPYTIHIGPSTSAGDVGYQNRAGTDVQIINQDNDQAGITVSPAGNTSEPNGTSTFTVVLASQPAANVAIPLSSSRPLEGVIAAVPTGAVPPAIAQLVFTPTNWNALQTVTLRGVDDLAQDGNQSYSIVTGAAVSTDTGYSGLNASDVALLNIDNDTAGILVTPPANPTTTEGGGTTTFTVQLRTLPAANVMIPLSTSNNREGVVATPATAQLAFTTANWNVPQTVTVRGVQDAIDDGDLPYSILVGPATSTDGNYNTRSGADVRLTNIDDDARGIRLTVGPQPLTTTEAGGTATFTIVLNSQPLGAVSIPVSTGNPAEGRLLNAMAQPATSLVVTFLPDTWSVPQTVTIVGQDDPLADGNQLYTVTIGTSVSSSDPGYDGLPGQTVSLSNTDNEAVALLLSTTTCNTSAGPTTFIIRLQSQPIADVALRLTISSATSGSTAVFSPATANMLTSVNWMTGVQVTVTGPLSNTTTVNYDVTATASSPGTRYQGQIATLSCVDIGVPPPPPVVDAGVTD